MATLAELQSVYGLEDLHDMLEVLSVDSINEQRAAAMARAMRNAAAEEAKARRRW